MKWSQLYLLLGQMCFVGSFLTNHLTDSLLLFGMMIFWHVCAIILMQKEREVEKAEFELESLKFKIIVNLLDKKGRKK